MSYEMVWLAIAFPLCGAAVNGLLGRYLSKRISGIIGCTALALSFIVAVLSYFSYKSAAAGQLKEVMLWPWIHSGDLALDFKLLVDPLSLTFLLFVTGISFLIHLYSTAYMAHDDGYSRFFTYLNLFVTMMLTLILGGNTALMFVGWEGVGLCSYLLIGFWYRDMYNANCGMKAFVVNRIGDFGVLLGMFLIWSYLGTLDFAAIVERAPNVIGNLPVWIPTAIALCLFLGACGKSAQFPLHIWLPDAMAGPTPVSALIHAATMVTAGVYMVVRLHPVYAASPTASLVVAVVGTLTAFMAATIALTQNDIKKVLAYSTVSQLGFMFVACGVGAYWVAIFHVVTHAFFKACLFLGSGSVIHAMHEEQDTRYMGGLAKYMPLTYWTFMISTLAIAGIPPLAGFFSKDEILWKVASWQTQFGTALPWALYGILLLTAGMTAFYMGRVTFKTFLGAPRWTDAFRSGAHGHGHGAHGAHRHIDHGHVAEQPTDAHAAHSGRHSGTTPHESSPAMTTPLIVLAAGAVVMGFLLFLPHWIADYAPFEHWLEPSTAAVTSALHGEAAHGSEAHNGHGEKHGGPAGLEIGLALLSVLIAVFALFGLAKPWFTSRLGITDAWKERYKPVYAFSLNKWFIDEFYHKTIVIPGIALALFAWKLFDVRVIDGIVNGTAWVIGGLGQAVRPLQTGFVRNYALYLLGGAVLYLAYSFVK